MLDRKFPHETYLAFKPRFALKTIAIEAGWNSSTRRIAISRDYTTGSSTLVMFLALTPVHTMR